MKIIITGSLGNISKPLVQELVKKGHDIVVISRDKEKKIEIEALGATAAIGTMEDTGFLTAAFTGADAVYTMMPPNFTEGNIIDFFTRVAISYASAIDQAGVKRVVQLSSWGASLEEGSGFMVGSRIAESVLDKLTGITITYLRPCYLYTNLLRYADMIKHAGMIGTNFGGEDKLVMVSPEDIAAVAAEELETSFSRDKIRYIASDERTCNDIARVLGEAIGKPELKWLTFSDEQAQKGMEKNGIPAFITAKAIEINASIHNGRLRKDYDLHQPLAMGKTKLEDFAKEFATEFKQSH